MSLKMIEFMVIFIRFFCVLCNCREVNYICFIFCDLFLKIFFNVINIRNILVNENIDILMIGVIYGIVEKIEKIDNLIDVFDFEEYIDEGVEWSLNLYVDIYVGIEVIGELKLFIKNGMGIKDDLEKCVKYLKLFVKFFIMRYVLIMRYKFCLELKKCSRFWRSILYRYIEKERKDV